MLPRQSGLAQVARAQFKHRAAPMGVMMQSLHGSVVQRKDEEPLPPTFSEKYQLHEPTRWVPLVAGGFGLASITGLYHWDAESQMLGLFVLFVGTIYSQGGDAIGKMFDDTADAILKEQTATEDAQIEAVKTAIEANKKQMGIYSDIEQIYGAQKALMEDVSTAAVMKLKHEVRDNFVRKLETVVKVEQDALENVRKTLVNNATNSVRQAFMSGDSSLKTDALANALAAIKDPSAQKDQIGDLYNSYFAEFRKRVSDSTGKDIELTDAEAEEASDTLSSIARRDALAAAAVGKKHVFEGF